MTFANWLNEPYQQLLRRILQGRLHHATMILGEAGVGQRQLADAAAVLLLCQSLTENGPCGQCHGCQLFNAGNHADLMLVDPEGATIRVDTIRDLNTQMSKKSQVGKVKVAVISQAQRMNINAANALLKMLEEPPENSYFLLTSTSASSLLPTIRSRCQLINIQPAPSAVSAWLTEQNLSNADQLAWLGVGPYDLLALDNSQELDFYRNFPLQLQRWLASEITTQEWLKGAKSEEQGWYLKAFSAFFRATLAYSAGQPLPVVLEAPVTLALQRFTLDRLLQIHQRLLTLQDSMNRTNLNTSLQLTAEINSW